MPSGRTHAIITTAIAATLLASGHPYCASGAALGLVVTPDLDVDTKRAPDNVIWSLYGERAKDMWRAFWMAYSKAMPHRSIRSHFPVISTVIRIAYVATWLIGVFILIYLAAAQLMTWPANGWAVLIARAGEAIYRSMAARWMFCGLVSADTAHFVADILVSEVKLWTKPKRRKRYAKSKWRSRRR